MEFQVEVAAKWIVPIRFTRRRITHDSTFVEYTRLARNNSMRSSMIMLDQSRTFQLHVTEMARNLLLTGSTMLSLLCQCGLLSLQIKLIIYTVFLKPILTHRFLSGIRLTKPNPEKLEVLQNRMLRMTTGAPTEDLGEELPCDISRIK